MQVPGRLVSLAIISLASGLLAGCVDPAHSKWASKGSCEVSTGSHICSDGQSESAALTSNGDAALRQVPGTLGVAGH